MDASHAKRNHARGVLRVGRSPLVRSYLKFDASGVKGTITGARLVLAPRSSSRSGVTVLSAGNGWSERNITFKNAPAPRTVAASSGRVRRGRGRLSLDVTRLVKHKSLVTLVLRSRARRGSSDSLTFANRERSTRQQPRLVIETARSSGDPSPSTPPLPGPTAPPPSPTIAPPAFPSWNGDFSTGDWSQYDSRPDNHPDGRPQDFSIVTNPTPPGFRYAGAFTVGPNSIAGSDDGTRALSTLWPEDDNPAAAKSRAYEGADSWYRDAFYLPASFTPAPNTAWNWLWEIHNYPDGPDDANLQLGIVTDNADGGPKGGQRLSLWVMGGASAANPVDEKDYWCLCNPDIKDRWMIGLNSVPRDRWVDVVIHVKWTYRQTGGLVEWWVDGKKVGTYSGPTLYYYKSVGGPGQGYLAHGYYRPRGSMPTVTVYHGATMIGPSAASVGSTVGSSAMALW